MNLHTFTDGHVVTDSDGYIHPYATLLFKDQGGNVLAMVRSDENGNPLDASVPIPVQTYDVECRGRDGAVLWTHHKLEGQLPPTERTERGQLAEPPVQPPAPAVQPYDDAALRELVAQQAQRIAELERTPPAQPPAPDKLALTVALANAAIAGGVRAGDLRWLDPSKDFALNGVPMDAPSLIAHAAKVCAA